MNPMHTVPTMDDGGYILWESKAIMHYLLDKYDKDSKFKPDNIEHAGRDNQILNFEGATLFERLGNYIMPVFADLGPPNSASLEKIKEALGALEKLLDGRQYAAGGSHLTLADFALTSVISTMEAIKVDFKPYPNVMKWYKKMSKELPGFESIDQKGAAMVGAGFAAKAG